MMKIIDPYFEVVDQPDYEWTIRKIEKIARICYKSEDKMTDDLGSARRIVANLIKNDHLAMLEHDFMTILFVVDRGISHELVRHRIASFAQESTRYCNYSKDKFGNEITVVKPYWLEYETPDYDMWEANMKDCETGYFYQLSQGYSPEKARACLPTSLKTEIVVTANFREWRHILKLRTSYKAHPQMREIMCPLLTRLAEDYPEIFGDILKNYVDECDKELKKMEEQNMNKKLNDFIYKNKIIFERKTYLFSGDVEYVNACLSIDMFKCDTEFNEKQTEILDKAIDFLTLKYGFSK